MKRILLFLPIIVLLVTMLESCLSKSSQTPLVEYPTDSIDVSAPLKPNKEWYEGRHTYGDDSIVGNAMSYRMASDSSDIYVKLDITLLELHPKITSNLLSFSHNELLNWGFVPESDTIPPFNIKELAEDGTSQQDIARKVFGWESKSFYKQLSDILPYGTGYNIEIEIYPGYLDDDYVTYEKFSYYYTGGAHANYSSFLQTYNRHTGESVDLEDIVRPEKLGEFRKHVVSHMASKYPIYSEVNSVESYLDSLNSWKGLTDIGVVTGLRKSTDLARITVENYPINDPGIHEAGLVITYEKYQLTPGISGCPVILLPFDEIRDCLKEPFCNYKSDITKLIGYKDRNDRGIPTEEIDSIRRAWSPADDGGQWPRDIYDWYKYRHGEINRQIPMKQIWGTWIGYGHLYDPRHILTLKPDSSFIDVKEEALIQNESGEILYNYTETIHGKYEYDIAKNRLTFKNWRRLPQTEENLEAYIKLINPNNEYMIIHSIVGDTMYVADNSGDLWPYIRQIN